MRGHFHLKLGQKSLRVGVLVATLLISTFQTVSAKEKYPDNSRDQFRSEIHNLLLRTHSRVLDYGAARQKVIGELHVISTPKGAIVREVYCLDEYLVSSIGSGNGPVNVEHTWPQSRFNDRFAERVQKSDLHHLYPSDKEMNSRRGNMEFGDVDGPSDPLKCRHSRIEDDSPRRFEPPDSHKGNVARAIFYFAVRYDLKVSASEESALRNWSRFDPVDADERDRNARIEQIQGNRNPFIDNPEWVDRITDF